MAIDKILKLSDLQEMPTQVLLNAYREGYRLEATNQTIQKLATGCPVTVKLGSPRTLTNIVTGGSGSSAIAYHWKITKPDNTIDTSPTTSVVNYSFDVLGNYVVETWATADCQGAQSTSNIETCTVIVNPTGEGVPGCTGCDLTKNYCVFGKCIPKTMALIGGAVLGAILIGS
jgi:hypothetical protein